MEEISPRFGVTPATTRRDPSLLTEQGMVTRTCSGALALNCHPESPLRQRAAEGYEANRSIARWSQNRCSRARSCCSTPGHRRVRCGEFLCAVDNFTVITGVLTALGHWRTPTTSG
ncbi:DeoR family transcriptional regulator [Mycolicibacterium palauense]|uniref:DeoR family transcriptional regulator n=1 Tax=Mycolicibacterium palauense TaxID=2034511 RepID=UPI001FE46F52|nr:DeoR family transcriptional regulator [Mycolicibacterium palauense]